MPDKHVPSVERALRDLGTNIRIARKKRRMSVADFAERMGVSRPTVTRLETGDGGVSVANLAMALRALGELDRLGDLMDMAQDDTGLMMDSAALPQRIRKRGVRRPAAAPHAAPAGLDEPPAAKGATPARGATPAGDDDDLYGSAL